MTRTWGFVIFVNCMELTSLNIYIDDLQTYVQFLDIISSETTSLISRSKELALK